MKEIAETGQWPAPADPLDGLLHQVEGRLVTLTVTTASHPGREVQL